MKSIFEIHDGDAVEPGYSIPGYEITVRPSRATQNRLEVFRPGGVLDAELTVGLRRFDGMPWNRDTMIKVGIWLQRKEAAAGRGRISLTASFRPEHPAEHVTLSPDAFRGDRFDSANAGGALPGLREAADAAVRRRAEEREREARRDALAFFNEAFSEAGVVIESLSVEALEGTVRWATPAASRSRSRFRTALLAPRGARAVRTRCSTRSGARSAGAATTCPEAA